MISIRIMAGFFQVCFSLLLCWFCLNPTAAADAPFVAPKFTTEPSDTIAKPGSSVLLRCRAQGNPAPTYRWSRNGQDFAPKDTGRVRLRPSGDLYFERVDPVQDEATYRCVVEITRYSYKIISKKADLKIVEFPTAFKIPPKPVSGYAGGGARLSAYVGDYEALPLIAWRYKGKATMMNNDKRFTVLPQGVLQISSLRSEEEGEVQAIARDPLGSSMIMSDYVSVTVQPGRPKGDSLKFLAKPENLQLRWGKSAVLECFGDSPSKVTYTWLKDGKPLPSNDRYSTVGEGNFKISYVREEDDGMYTCRIQDGTNQLDASAKLEVQIPPLFTLVPSKQVGRRDGAITFRYQVRGVPKPTIRWYKDGITIGSVADYIEQGDGYFTLNGLIKSDKGMYQVFALNPLGEAQAEVELIVLDRGQPLPSTTTLTTPTRSTVSVNPGKPENVQAVARSSSEILVSWEEPQITNGNIIRYVVVYYSSPNSAKPLIVGGTERSALISGLTPNTKYFFKVQAINQAAPGALSLLVSATTLAASMPKEVGSFSAGKPSSDSIYFSWKAPTSGPAVTRYVVYYMNMDDAKSQTFQKSTSTTSVTITGLQPSSTYKFWVIPYSGLIMGERSTELTIQTEKEPPRIPDQVRDLIVTLGSAKVITLSWNAPINGPKPTRYKVYYQAVYPSGSPQSLETTALTAFIQNLKGNTRYKVWVVPYAGNYPGPKSREATITTPVGKPTVAPQLFKMDSAGPSFIRLSWTGLTDEESGGELLGYRLQYYVTGSKSQAQTITLGRSSTEVLLSKLLRDTEYTVRLAGYSSAGNGPLSTITVRTAQKDGDKLKTASEPRNFKALVDPDHPDIAALSWQPPITYTGSIKTYIIFYRKESAFDWSKMKVDGDRLTSNVSDIEPATTYYLKIQAEDGNGEGATTLPVQFISLSESSVPGSVTDLSVTPYPTYLIINWNPPSEAFIVTSGYKVKVTDAVTGNVLSSFTLTGRKKTSLNVLKDIEPGQKYYVSVTAFNNAGTGRITKVLATTPTVPKPVVKVYDIRVGVKDASFKWYDDNPTTTGYYIKFFTYDAKGMPLERIVIADQREVAITGLNAFTEYKFYIRRQSDADFPTQPSIIIKTKAAVPSAPLDVTAAGHKKDQTWIALNWQVPEYPNGNIKQYIIRYSTRKDLDISQWKYVETGSNVMTFNVTGLSPGLPYYFRVFAENEAGTGAGSAILDPTTGPSAPLGLTGAKDKNYPTWILLRWSAPEHPKGKIKQYIIRYTSDKDLDITKWKRIETGNDVNTFNVTGLAMGETFFFQVFAENQDGIGAGSNILDSSSGGLTVPGGILPPQSGTSSEDELNGKLWWIILVILLLLFLLLLLLLLLYCCFCRKKGEKCCPCCAKFMDKYCWPCLSACCPCCCGAGSALGPKKKSFNKNTYVAAPNNANGYGSHSEMKKKNGKGQDFWVSTGGANEALELSHIKPNGTLQTGGGAGTMTVNGVGGGSGTAGGAVAGGTALAGGLSAGTVASGIGGGGGGSVAGAISKAGVKVALPGDATFISYKTSLQDYCQKVGWLPPYYSVQQGGTGFFSTVSFGGNQSYSSGAISSSSKHVAEQQAALAAMKGIGLLSSDTTHGMEANISIPSPGEPSFISYKCSLHDFCQQCNILPPRFVTARQGSGFISQVQVGSHTFNADQMLGSSSQEAEQFAAFTGLQGLCMVESSSKYVPDACFTVPGPGDQSFVSFKSSLHDFCQRYKLPPPQYITTQQPQGYSAKLKFGGLFFQSSDYFPTRLEAEQHAAFEALQGLGLLESAVRFGSGDGSRVNAHGSTPSLSTSMVTGTVSQGKPGTYNKAGSTSQLNYFSGSQDIDIPPYRTLGRQSSRDHSVRADFGTGGSSVVSSSNQESHSSRTYASTLERSHRSEAQAEASSVGTYSRQYSNGATYDVPAKSIQSNEHSYSQKSYLIGGSPSLSPKNAGKFSYSHSSSSGRTTPTLSNTRVFIASESSSSKPKGYQAMSETRNILGKDASGMISSSGYATTGGYSLSYQQTSVKSASSTLPRRMSPYTGDGQYQYSAKSSTLGGNTRAFASSSTAMSSVDGVPRSASHPALSELEREMQGLEGLIRDLNGITASEQELYA